MGQVKREASAVAQVEQMTTWHPLEWWRIEAGAWNGHREVLDALRAVAPSAVRPTFAPGRPPIWAMLYVALSLAAAVTPAAAAFIAYRAVVRDRVDPLVLAPLGIAILLAALVLAADLVLFRNVTRARVASGSYALGLAHLIPSLTLLGLIAFCAATGRLGPDAWWTWAVVLDVLVGVVLIVQGRPARAAAPETPDFSAVDAVVAGITRPQRDAVRADLEAAIAQLQQRGVIGDEEAAIARSAPLGRLGSTLVVPAA